MLNSRQYDFSLFVCFWAYQELTTEMIISPKHTVCQQSFIAWVLKLSRPTTNVFGDRWRISENTDVIMKKPAVCLYCLHKLSHFYSPWVLGIQEKCPKCRLQWQSLCSSVIYLTKRAKAYGMVRHAKAKTRESKYSPNWQKSSKAQAVVQNPEKTKNNVKTQARQENQFSQQYFYVLWVWFSWWSEQSGHYSASLL